MHDRQEQTVDNAVRRQAQMRWNLLRTHVRVTRRLLLKPALDPTRQFLNAQYTLIDAWIGYLSAPDSMTCPFDRFLALRDQFLSLFDAEHCILSVNVTPSSVIEFDGQHIVGPSTGTSMTRQRTQEFIDCPTFYSTATACANALIKPPDGWHDLKSYLCLPLVDCNDHIQAIVEIFNTRYQAHDITTWLGNCEMDHSKPLRSFQLTRSPLIDYCGFVGALIRSITSNAGSENVLSSKCQTSEASSLWVQVSHVLDSLQRALGLDGWIVYAHDQDANVLWACRVSVGVNHAATVHMGHGIIGRAASTAEPLFDTDMLCIPTFESRQNCDVDLCRVICSHVGAFLHQLAIEETAKTARMKAQALLEVSDLLFRELDRSPKPATMLIKVARMIVQKTWFCTSECTVFLRDPLTHELYSPGNATQGELSVPVSSASVRAMAAVRTGNVVNLYDAESKHNKPVLAIPVKDPTSGSVLAIFEMVDKQLSSNESPLRASREKVFFDQQDEELARDIARLVASALRHTQRLDAARMAQRKSAALLSLRLPAAIGAMPGDQAGAVFSSMEAATCKALQAAHGALFIVDAPSRSLFARVGADWRGYSLPIGQRLQGRVAATGAALRLVREAQLHPEFDSEYDRILGLQTSSLLCVPIKAQPLMGASSSTHFGSSSTTGRAGRRCSSSFSTCSSTDDDGDDRPVIGVFYAVNKININGESEGFDSEDEQVLRAICVELSTLVERRAWELVFESPSYDDSDSSDSEGESHVTRTFLSQYTTASPIRRRRRPRSRLPSVVSDHDHAAAIVAATSYHECCFFGSSGNNGTMLAAHINNLNPVPGQGASSPILQWNLDVWQFSPAQLIDLAVDMFKFHDLMDSFSLSEATLRRFLHSVQTQYLDVPYHNTYHAFTTLHVTFLLLSAQSKLLAPSLIPASSAHNVGPSTKARAIERSRQRRCGELILSPRERLAVFVAAFCHDMGHDARTNDFHVRCSSRLARRYNDHSVLENMHAAACFETMRRPGHDVLAGLEDGSSETVGIRRAVRKRIIRAILATDMHRHASVVAKLHEAQVRGSRNDDEALRELLVDAVVHSADISGPTQTEEQHFRWTTRLLQEFNEQHAEEVELGISATAFMDGRPDSAEFARVNLAFVDSCAFPLWKALSGLLTGLEGCLANVERNRTMWATRLSNATALEADAKKEKCTTIPASEPSPERLSITKKLVRTLQGLATTKKRRE
ncbi:cyclic nucleotide [Plasmopara halstedii]|uniref:Phosphodiesterase n=1 Tax=Plasmopara halstedii TaxID=4781 RepID=A0A0P1AEX9_PLAHL|nr:cyclic nucleotide [Plasmopara halstedii]CEG39649.1 cyclic nucleotide [Plasmopara halstedii]|eukprot:XP_024576018.1 cyclic nucleotide [Plasmopara halstedii]